MEYTIAIPSYKRYSLLLKKSLKILHEGGIPQNNIRIFVANNDEKERYKQYLENNSKLSNYKPKEYNIVVGVKGIGPQRKWMVRYFASKKIENVVFMDDDVNGE